MESVDVVEKKMKKNAKRGNQNEPGKGKEVWTKGKSQAVDLLHGETNNK